MAAKGKKLKVHQPCKDNLTQHIIDKHMSFTYQRQGAGRLPKVWVSIFFEGVGESPCPYCSLQSASVCPWPC